MNDMLAARDSILNKMVEVKNRHAELVTQQHARIEAVTLSCVPDSVAVDLERVALSEETSLLAEFQELLEDFPAFHRQPVFQEVVGQGQQGMLTGLFNRKKVEAQALSVVVDDAEARESGLQDGRLAHLVSTVLANLADRRLALQHGSFVVKRAVVSLNQAAAFSPDEADVKKIEKERHRLEVLVGILESASSDNVIASRTLGLAADRLAPRDESQLAA